MKKVDLLGVQDDKIFVEVAPARLAVLGLTPAHGGRGAGEAECAGGGGLC